MKTYTKPLAIGLTLLSLTVAGPVLAEEGPAPGGFAAEHGGPWGANRKHFIEERLAQLHKELKLTSAQEADWKTWSDKVNQVRAAKKEALPDLETLRKLSAPDRLQKMIEFGKTRHAAAMEDILTATRTFYATLTPEQRKTFDDLTPFGERALKWHHGGPRHPGAQ
jgi:periplasmic protein CpxP/Spy